MNKLTIKNKILLAIPVYGLVYRYNHLYHFKTTVLWDVYQLFISPLLIGWVFIKFIGYNINF